MIEYYKNLSLENLFYIDENGIVQEEEWRHVFNYEKIYLCSVLGRFKRIGKTIFIEGTGSGTGLRKIPEKIMKCYINEDGYLALGLTKNKKQSTLLSHRLISEVFIPNLEGKPYVNHKDCVKTNNIVTNLEWSTVEENNRHSWANGRNVIPKGELNGASKLNSTDILKIRALYSERNMKNQEIADIFGIHKNYMYRIATKRAWKHI
jgi:hypothetical protein